MAQCSNYCFYVSQIANLWEKQGQIDKAIQIILDAQERFRASTTKENRLSAEKIPLAFPNESDTETQLAELYLKNSNFEAAKQSAQSAVGLIEDAVGKDNPTLRRPLTFLAEAIEGAGDESAPALITERINKLPQVDSKSEPSENDLYRLLEDVYTASGATLHSDLQELQQAYANQDSLLSHERNINLFCALLAAARSLSNRGFFSEANGMLDFLKKSSKKEMTPCATGLLELERAINSARQNTNNSAESWLQAVDSIPLSSHLAALVSRSGSNHSDAFRAALKGEEIFRIMAVAYAVAGDSDRAIMLLKQAHICMQTVESDAHLIASTDRAAIARTKVFLLLDSARIGALAKEITDVVKLGEQAVTLCSATPPTKLSRNFNETYRLKLYQLGLAMKEHGAPNRTIETLLAFALSNMNKGASAVVPPKPDPARYSEGHYALVDALMAQLYLEDGNLKLANQHATKAIKMLGADPFSIWYRAADIAYQIGDFEAAAHRYSEAEGSCVFIREGHYFEKEKAICLQKAVESALKASNLKPVEAANIYLRMAESIEYPRHEEALKYFEKAYALTPDSDPRKPRLLGKIAEITGSVASTQHSRDRTGGNARDPGEVEKDAAKTEVSLLKQSALLAEKIDPLVACGQWRHLSMVEVSAGMLIEALAAENRALFLKQKPFEHDSLGGIEVSSNGGLIPELAKNGRAAEAETLLLDALKLVKTTYGEQSPAAAAQLAQLIVFYFNQNDNAKAFRSLHDLLSLNLRTMEVGFRYNDSAEATLEDCALALVAKGKGELAVQILQKILAAQREAFEPDNEGIALSLLTLAEVNEAIHNTEDAKGQALEAARIFALYDGILHLGRSSGGRGRSLEELWKKLYPDYEAKNFDVRQIGSVNTKVLRMLGDEKDAAQIEQFQKMPPDYLDPFYGSPRLDAKASPASQIEQLQKDYSAVVAVAPYSARAGGDLETMMRIALNSKDWQTLAKVATARAIIYEHEPDGTAGRQRGCVVPPTARLDYYNNAARAYLALGQISEAQKWIDRGIKVLVAKTSTEWITFAELELECGKPDLAVQCANHADKLCSESDYFASYPERSAALWKKLGQPDRAAAILAKSEAVKNKHLQQSEQYKNSAFSGTRM